MLKAPYSLCMYSIQDPRIKIKDRYYITIYRYRIHLLRASLFRDSVRYMTGVDCLLSLSLELLDIIRYTSGSSWVSRDDNAGLGLIGSSESFSEMTLSHAESRRGLLASPGQRLWCRRKVLVLMAASWCFLLSSDLALLLPRSDRYFWMEWPGNSVIRLLVFLYRLTSENIIWVKDIIIAELSEHFLPSPPSEGGVWDLLRISVTGNNKM